MTDDPVAGGSPAQDEGLDSAPRAASTGAKGRPRLTLIVNPIATTVSTKRTREIQDVLGRRFDVTVARTEAQGHATELAQTAVLEGADVVAVYAGDGTTNEAIRALAGTHTALAHLPGGNASVLARMLGMGSDGVKAARRVGELGGATRTIDLGRVEPDGGESRPFSFTAGVGLDGAVVKLVDSDLARKHRFRWGAFWMEAVRLAREEYIGAEPMLTVESGGVSKRGVTGIVQNAEAYTYLGPRALTVGDGATLTSGTLAAVALRSGLGYRDIPSITFRTVAPVKATGHPRIDGLPPSAEVWVRCDRPMPMQVDGDYWCDVTNARFTVQPAALRVVA